MEIGKANIIDQANRDNAQWPQYRGHWDGAEWRVIRLKRSVRTKGGQAFLKGDVTIAKDESLSGRPTVFAYSLRNRIDTALDPKWVQWLT